MRVARRQHNRWLRRLFYAPLLTLLLSLGFGVGVVEATDGMRGNKCVVQTDEYIAHDFYFLCRSLTVYGTIDGDLIGFASDVTVAREGTVTGDIWVVGGQLTIKGQVGDDLRFGGLDLDITERTEFPNEGTDVTAWALSAEISAGTRVPGDLLMIGYQALVFGDIGGNIDFEGQRLEIQGQVEGNVDAVVGDSSVEISLRSIPFLPYSVRLRDYGLYVGDEAYISGDLRYEAARQANVPRRAVGETTKYTRILQQVDITAAQQPRTFLNILKNYLIEVTKDTLSLMLVGILALQFAPVLIVEPSIRVRHSLIPAFSWGLILFVLFFPIGLLSIIVSIILVGLVTLITLSALTLTVGVFLTIVNLIFFFAFWFMLVYLGRAITCFLIGYSLIRAVRFYLAKRHHDPDDPPIYIPPIPARQRWLLLVVGTIIYSSLVNMPLPTPFPTFQLILEAGIALSGLGAIFLLGRDIWYLYEGKPDAVSVRRRRPETDLPEDTDMPLGTENLPEGFRGFYD